MDSIFSLSSLFPFQFPFSSLLQRLMTFQKQNQNCQVVLRSHEEVSQDHFRPFHNWSFGEPNWQLCPHFICTENITKSSPRRTIASCGSASLTGSQKALGKTQKILHLPSTPSPASEIFSKAKLPYVFELHGVCYKENLILNKVKMYSIFKANKLCGTGCDQLSKLCLDFVSQV